MSAGTNDLRPKAEAKVVLDGRVVQVPENVSGSLTAIRDFLEIIALHQERLLVKFSVDGVEQDLKASEWEISSFRQVTAESMSFFDLGKQVIGQVRQQMQSLKRRVENIMLQVVINEWSTARQLWGTEWQKELASPLLVFNYLKKLCGARIEELTIGQKTLAEHMERFTSIWNQLQSVFEKKNNIGFSDALELSYLPWLNDLIDYLVLLEND